MRARLLLALIVLLAATPALASRPVPRTMTGCVAGGSFTNDAGYVIRVRTALGADDLDLARYEGRRIRASGNLLPGDVFVLTRPIAVIGRCPP